MCNKDAEKGGQESYPDLTISEQSSKKNVKSYQTFFFKEEMGMLCSEWDNDNASRNPYS